MRLIDEATCFSKISAKEEKEGSRQGCSVCVVRTEVTGQIVLRGLSLINQRPPSGKGRSFSSPHGGGNKGKRESARLLKSMDQV